MRRLIPLGDNLRSYLGTVALLVFVLPVVVLVLTLVDEDSAPRPMKTSDFRDGSSDVAKRQARPADTQLDGNGEGDVLPVKRQRQSLEKVPKDNRASSTRQIERDQKAVHQPQDAPGTATGVSATATEAPTPTEQLGSHTAPASTEAPNPLVLSSAPATAEAPAPGAPSTPAAAEPATASEPSAAMPADPVLAPSEVPLEGAQGYDYFEQVQELP